LHDGHLAQQSSGSIEFYELKFIATSKTLFHRNRPSFLHKQGVIRNATGEAVKIEREGGLLESHIQHLLLADGTRPVQCHGSSHWVRKGKSPLRPAGRQQDGQKTSQRFRQRWLPACIPELDDEVRSDFKRHPRLQGMISAETFKVSSHENFL
jgi:hypothetical protein